MEEIYVLHPDGGLGRGGADIREGIPLEIYLLLFHFKLQRNVTQLHFRSNLKADHTFTCLTYYYTNK